MTYPSEIPNLVVYQKLIAQEEVGFPGGSLPMQETQVRSLIWEDPTCHRATEPKHLHSATREATAVRNPSTATRE